jgi:hypothetical protein
MKQHWKKRRRLKKVRAILQAGFLFLAGMDQEARRLTRLARGPVMEADLAKNRAVPKVHANPLSKQLAHRYHIHEVLFSKFILFFIYRDYPDDTADSALAQESLSTSSLGRPSNSGRKEGFRGKFSIGRVRSRSPAARAIPSPSLSPTCTPVHPSFPPQTFLQNGHDETSLPAESDSYKIHYPARPLSSSSSEDDRHPYANPDLVISYAVEPLPKSPLRSAMQFPPRNDSNLTVTDSFTTLTLSNSGTRSTLSSDGLSTSSSSRDRLSSLQGRDISSPVSAHSISKDEQVLPVPPPGVVNLPGWTDRVTTPAFSLISLEEARAQRMRGSSNHDTASRSSNASAVSSSMTPIPSNEHETTNIADVISSGGSVSRTRGRTISAGAKAKNALQTIVGQKPDRRGSEPAIFGNQPPLGAQPNKTLKHKKSGFMRLFNSGKTNEKDEPEAPPVPSLSDAYAAHNQQHSRGAQKATLHRIPVPSISPSMFEASPVHDTISSGDSSTSVSASLNPRRTPPSLHINTLSQGLVPRGAASARGSDEFHQTRTLPTSSETPWQIESQPQSAPANVSQFPSLRLRPVSSLFSTHFADHIVSDPRPIYETDLDTPRSSSPTGLVSPVTPASYSRSSNEPSMTSISGDSSSLVQAFQEQIIFAKKAWQQHIWELEGQVRDLKAEVEELKASGKDNTFCSTCGRGEKRSPDGPKHDILSAPGAGSVVNRPRARTGTSSRFGNAMP